MIRFSPHYVRPLGNTEMDFLEVLVARFALSRTPKGAILKLDLASDDPVIWQREGKSHVASRIPDFAAKSRKLQARLDGILLNNQPGQSFKVPSFPFRYASGGTLPIVRFLKSDEYEYYCLFYREVFPVGWNIANGGADNLGELLNPFRTVERELREELVMFSGKRKSPSLYVFEHESGRPELRPEYAAARILWQDLPEIKNKFGLLQKLKERLVPVRWLDGPDSLHLQFNREQTFELQGCYLNINAEDFGIEIDRIASLGLPCDTILYDGELMRSGRVGAIVGLFEAEKTRLAVSRGQTVFFPDLFYYECEKCTDPHELSDVIERYIQRMARQRRPKWDRRSWDRHQFKFNLCPVTRRIILRHAQFLASQKTVERSTNERSDIFVSFASKDLKLAKTVVDFLRNKTGKTVFFSGDKNQEHFTLKINKALESSTCFVAVASDPNNLRGDWVDYECRAFDVLIKAGQKPTDAKMISYIKGFDPRALPLPLVLHEAIQHNRGNPRKSLEQLLRFV